MKIYFHHSASQHNEYTHKLLCYLFQRYGGQVVSSPDHADLCAASICSIRELSTVITARVIAERHHIPLLVGGAECYIGAPLLAWADYLCVGEGFGILRALARDGLDALDSVGNVLSRSNQNREITPDYVIPWGDVPVIQTARRAYYFLHGRGCRKKCRFCYTSWTQPHQTVYHGLISHVIKKIPHGAHIIWVTNDDGLIAHGAGSTTVQQFLRSEQEHWPRVIRLGIEGVTEERRSWLGKKISDDQIIECLDKAKRLNVQLQLFFIIGFEDEKQQSSFEIIANKMGAESIRFPRVYVKFTWFEACPHTPLANYDLRKLCSWDYERELRALRAISGRFRLFKAGVQSRSIWSSVMRRLSPSMAEQWYVYKNKVAKMSIDQAIKVAISVCGEDVVAGRGEFPWQRIKVCTKL